MGNRCRISNTFEKYCKNITLIMAVCSSRSSGRIEITWSTCGYGCRIGAISTISKLSIIVVTEGIVY